MGGGEGRSRIGRTRRMVGTACTIFGAAQTFWFYFPRSRTSHSRARLSPREALCPVSTHQWVPGACVIQTAACGRTVQSARVRARASHGMEADLNTLSRLSLSATSGGGHARLSAAAAKWHRWTDLLLTLASLSNVCWVRMSPFRTGWPLPPVTSPFFVHRGMRR